MSEKIKNSIYFLGGLVILSFLIFVFVLIVKSFTELSHTEPLTKDFIISFTGAFFAFLFIRIGDSFNKIYKRQVKNRNALVKIEYEGNRLLNSIYEEIFVIDEFLNTINEIKEEKTVVICFNHFKQLPFDRSVLLELSNIDFINKLFSFVTDLEKFNDSIETIEKLYSEHKNAFMQHLIKPDFFIANTIELESKFIMFKKFGEQLTEETIDILSLTRVLIKEKPFLTWLMEKISKKNITDRDKKLAKHQKELLKKEIENSVSESRARIDSILKN